MRRRWLLLSTLLLVTAATLMPSAAAPVAGTGLIRQVAGGAALGAPRQVLTFAGSIGNPSPTASNPDPTVCAVYCDRWSLRVATTSPVLVSIRTANGSVDDGFNLYVYDASGALAGSSSGIGANGQAVLLPRPKPQDYLLVVTTTYAYDPDAGYIGEGRVLPATSTCSTRTCERLPQLAVVPPHDFHLSGVPPVPSTPLGFPFPVDAGTQSSCYLEETLDTGAMKCLRFTNEIRNVGAGPLELRFQWAGSGEVGLVPGQCQMQQVVHHGDGSVMYRPAGPCVFHVQHGHFHYQEMASLMLRQVNADGSTGPVVRQIAKQGFCLADDNEFWYGTARNRPRVFVGQPGCSLPGETAAAPEPGAWVHMGISPAWGDVYTWDTPQQYVDVTTLSDGLYDVVSIANPDGALRVAGERRPSAQTRICLKGDSVRTVAATATHC